ncbi:DNA translocase FtsK [Roseovarius sp. M141]|uniref:DNA translocase FtsK n=1 Tax=Roseovarius sp. M141 TaxID=2583806 RepID=UPI0020CDD140|nr:DNA translocase FtsK 4TM domain-containing protein [Roseovarius sp. M141]MCQ0091922.1 DNA translocase FtsK [Roseovarius sp. M141]
MAYQTRGRDPLLDSNMAQAIEKRGKELLGLALMGLAVLATMMFASYSAEDPSWLSAVDTPVQNWLGQTGATIAATLFMVVGWGGWGIAAVLAAWGIRFVLHKGQERAMARLIFAPIWIAVLSLYAASLTPGAEWYASHSFGLGGIFGDTVLGAILGVLPIGASIGLKLLSLVLGIGMLTLGAFVMGFERSEMVHGIKLALLGCIMAYSTLVALATRGASGAAIAARNAQARRSDRRIEASEPDMEFAQPRVGRSAHAKVYDEADAPVLQTPARAVEKTSTGLLGRMPSLMRKPEPLPEAEWVETQATAADRPMPGEDRIKEKIADIIKSRVRKGPIANMPVTSGALGGVRRGPAPLLLDTARAARLPDEPPLTAPPAATLPPEPPLSAPRAAASALEITSAPRMSAPAPHPESEAAFDAESFDEDEAVILDDTAPPPPAARVAPVPEAKKVVQHTQRKAVAPSVRAAAEAQPALQFEENSSTQYELPPLSLLSSPDTITRYHLSDEALEENARMLEVVLDDYGVKGEIVSVRPGPVVTMYELEPAPGLKASRVIGLSDDIARSMSALSARVSTVPGRTVIGIELPNDNREMVSLREILSTRDFGDGNHKLPLALGKDIGGDPMVVNLAKMPHLLIAGTTGSGKSVAINTMILSLLYKLTPEDCRMIMIDPKMLELSVYDGIPHLLSPVVTDPKKAVVALKWTVAEMEERYRKMSKMGVRNIDGYNGRVADALSKNEMFSRTVQTGFDDDTGEPVFETEQFAPEKMPYIVVIVDEMADLMMVAGKEIEACIQRLAQMARASGIHIIMATQRPSVDVITGTIKANFPTRISFQVTSKIDSRTILGEMGAEQLLGMGDMLYMAGGAKITRCHGPFVSDEEVEEVVNDLKAYGPPEYVGSVLEGPDEDKASNIDAVLGLSTGSEGEDALYDQAVQIAITDRKCSTSYIQRKLAIGYNKAARLVEQMEDEGVVSAANHVGKREILVPER